MGIKNKSKIIVAASIIAAIICTSELLCYGATKTSTSQDSASSSPKEYSSGYDDEALFSDDERSLISVPKDLKWEEKELTDTDLSGRKIRYVLKDKQVKAYIDGELVWNTDGDIFVQDMLVGDIDKEDRHKDEYREATCSENELLLLLWKKGRYGINRPFWVKKDEVDYSQHLFVYNLVNSNSRNSTDKTTENNSTYSNSKNKADKENEKRLAQKWCSSYMGFEASKMDFSDGILYLTDLEGETVPWMWNKFGFYRVEDTKLVFAGDNLLHIEIYTDALKNHDGDFTYLYSKIKPYLRKADISIINLETPLVKDPARYSTYPCFGSPVEVAKGLKKVGFTGVTLSTNHRFDKGASGVQETLDALDENDLIHVGSMDEKPYITITRNRITFALLNYTYGTNGIRPPKGYENGVNYLTDEEKIREDIRAARKEADFVIVCPHWGTEYMKKPDSWQKKWTKLFYEEGVDAVIGTHPHVIQPYEMYKEEAEYKSTSDSKSESKAEAEIDSETGSREMLVYYSLGNYISSNRRHEHNSGGIASFSVRKTVEGVIITDYDFTEIDTMFAESKY